MKVMKLYRLLKHYLAMIRELQKSKNKRRLLHFAGRITVYKIELEDLIKDIENEAKIDLEENDLD